MRLQCVRKTNASQKFSAHSVTDAVHNLSPVLRGIDVYAIRPFPKRCVYDANNRLRDGGGVGICWLQCGKPFERNSSQICVGPFAYSSARA
jgi:hypothetical protein